MVEGERRWKRGRNVALHREKSGHDGCPMVLSRVGFQLLVGGVSADESVHFLVVALFVHDDSRSPFVGRMDGDGIVLLEGLYR